MSETSARTGPVFQIRNGVELVCPYCGRKVQMGYLTVDGIDTEDYAGLHVEPMCETFEQTPLEDYVTMVRKHYVTGAGN